MFKLNAPPDPALLCSNPAAVVAGFASQVASVVRKSFIPGLGMSGIIMAYLAMTAVLQPEAEFTIIFFPFVNFSAMDTLRAIMLIDVVGLVLGKLQLCSRELSWPCLLVCLTYLCSF